MSVERLNDVETVEGFRYFENGLNAGGGSNMTVVIIRIG